jgi:murein DD-endopeptidase MepM/ murein hydrolase activator NlpD
MVSKSIILLLFSAFFLSSCATVEQPSLKTAPFAATPQAPAEGLRHVVAKGETLWRISKMYAVDIDTIVRANRIPESGTIILGETIVIPQNKTDDRPPETNLVSHNNNSDFIWPAKGKVVTRFKEKSDGVYNKGIDIATDPAQDVLASRDGAVTFIGDLAGYGATVIIDHQDGISSVYCGGSAIVVKTGDTVKQGMVIARTGKAPRQKNAALHFEIRKQHKPQNPLYYLD